MAAISASDIIKAALKDIGVLGIGQPVNAEVEQDTFRRLNNMLELWSLENLMIVADVEEAETLTAAQAEYTVGSGGDFDTNRPLTIRKDAFIRRSSVDYRVRVLTLDVYRDVFLKTVSARPRFLVLQPEFPLAKIYLYPTPNDSTDVLHYRASTLLDSFATLATEVDFAPGYELAVITNLARFIAAPNRKTVRPELERMASEAKRVIKNQNAEPVQPVKLTELSYMMGRRRWRNIEEGPFT